MTNPQVAADLLTRLAGGGVEFDLSSTKVSPAQAQRAAFLLDVPRPEARKAILAARYALKVGVLAGRRFTLPAMVDRAGEITPVAPMEAGRRVLATIARSNVLTVDVETSGYPIGHVLYRLRTVQLGDSWECAVFDPEQHGQIIGALLSAAPALHAHSATADLIPLAVAGFADIESLWDRMHDTVIPAKLGDPLSTGADPALKRIAEYVLREHAVSTNADVARKELFRTAGWLTDTEFDTPHERSGWAQVDSGCETMIRYAASDVLDTGAIGAVLGTQLPAAGVYARERLAQRMTARVTHVGVRLDAERVRELDGRHRASRDRHGAVLRERWGIEKPGSTPTLVAAFTGLGARLPTTKPTKTKPNGGPSTASGAIEPLAEAGGPVGELARVVLDWRHDNTAVGLFTAPYRALCEMGDGRARPTVYTLGTDTGRMSCVRPNMQQLPRAGGFRSMIVADPGQVMISADFAAVELRVAAGLSGDRNLTQIILDGRDVHWEIARLVYGPNATKAHRYRVKRGVFGRIYGGGVPTLADQMGVFPEVAQRMVDTMDAMLPGLTEFSNYLRNGVRHGRTTFETYSGRIIHLPPAFPHKAPNYAIQGTARELLVDALVKWRDTQWGTCPLLPVHDELDVFVPAEDGQAATAALAECMATSFAGIPIVAEAAAPSAFWQDSE